MPQKARDVKKALKAKGFEESDKRDHFYYFFHHGQQKTNIFTKISHNSSDISDNLCSQMARQVRLNNRQFNDLVECDLTHEGYIEILMQARILTPLEKPSS